MAPNQPKSDIRNSGRQSLGRGERPQGIEKQPAAIRKSARLKEIKGIQKRAVSEDTNTQKHPFPSPSTSNTPSKEVLPNSPFYPKPEAVKQLCSPSERKTDRKRKRSQEAQSPRVQDEPIEKRARISLGSCAVENKETATDTDNKKGDPINHWIREGNWPKECFEQEINMSLPLAQRKSFASLRRQALESSSVTPSQKTEDKSAPYKDPSYVGWLADNGSFLAEFRQGITEDSKKECQALLNTEQAVPQDSDSLFRDDLFEETCKKLQDRNEARVINDISRLIVPSAETLTTYGAIHLEHLIVGMNERWNESIPITATAARPQADFSVGFKRSAFTQDQLTRLEPYTGNVFSATKLSSFFLATWRMYFPFFTCEVKCGAGGLDVADRQNANSMTLAVRGVVELFRLVKREGELHRKVLAFSISHDDEVVRIFGHYPIIDGDKTTFYRHPIKKFDFTSEEGKDKWTAYKFTKNIYDVWMPDHHKLICSAIEKIPEDINFGVSLGDSFTSIASADNESELPDSQEITASALSSQDNPPYKKPKLPPKVMLQKENDRQKEQIDEQKDRINHLIGQVDLLKQQQSSNASSGNESMLLEQSKQKENDRQKEQIDEQKDRINHLIGQNDLLKQQQSSNASSGNESMLLEQSKQENDGLKVQNKKLMDRLEEFMDLLKQQNSANA